MPVTVSRAFDANAPSAEERKRSEWKRNNLMNQINTVANAYVRQTAIEHANDRIVKMLTEKAQPDIASQPSNPLSIAHAQPPPFSPQVGGEQVWAAPPVPGVAIPGMAATPVTGVNQDFSPMPPLNMPPEGFEVKTNQDLRNEVYDHEKKQGYVQLSGDYPEGSHEEILAVSEEFLRRDPWLTTEQALVRAREVLALRQQYRLLANERK